MPRMAPATQGHRLARRRRGQPSATASRADVSAEREALYEICLGDALAGFLQGRDNVLDGRELFNVHLDLLRYVCADPATYGRGAIGIGGARLPLNENVYRTHAPGPSGVTFFVLRVAPNVDSSGTSAGRLTIWLDDPVGHPCRRPTHREIPKWQKHEACTRKLAGGRVSGWIPNEVSSVRRRAQVPHEGTPVVDGAPAEVAKGLRMGGREMSRHESRAVSRRGRDGQALSLEECELIHGTHSYTAILPMQQVWLAGAGRATLSWRHINTASMTEQA